MGLVIPRSVFVPLLILLALFLQSAELSTMPSFTRQTGMPCTACHIQAFGPSLTPVGRNFKLTGYTMAADKRAKFVPLSAMVQGSLTHTQRGQGDAPPLSTLVPTIMQPWIKPPFFMPAGSLPRWVLSCRRLLMA